MEKQNRRLTIRVSDNTFEKLEYWSKKQDISINQYITECIDTKIALENADYDLPQLELIRLNQLIDVIHGLCQNVKNLEDVSINGFATIVNLARGDNYLVNEGE